MSEEFTTIEVWAVVNSDGESAIGDSQANAIDAFNDEGHEVKDGVRVFSFKVKVRLPGIVNLTLAIPDEPPAIVDTLPAGD